jgi:hypothetical protein
MEGIFNQQGIEQCQVILIDGTGEDHSEMYSRFPGLQYIRSEPMSSVAVPRREGLRAARAPIVAFLEDHVEPQPGWLKAILDAFARSEKIAMVNYAIKPEPDASYTYRALQMSQYGHWLLPIRSGPIRYACHQNLAYRRELIVPIAEEDFEVFESEFLMHRRLLSDGWSFWLAADAVIHHENYDSFRAGCGGFFALKQIIGAGRASSGNWPTWKRWLWAAAMPLTPFLLVGRLVRSVAPRPAHWGEFLLALPIMVASQTIGSVYEARGYLRGFEQSRETFVHFESNVERNV